MLAVLRGSGLGDVTVVVTRYFGGTLLGTGGLVHAYSDTTREVLAVLPRAEHIEKRTLLISIDYSAYALVHKLLEEYHADFLGEDFTTDVTLTVALPLTNLEPCLVELASITSGQAQVQEV
jgi:putative IMPACT (imprinted ancient) family translation regulator